MGSTSLRASSGSRSASSSIEPLRSANSTVTCLRSPSRAVREVRIFSARCRGVYVAGAGVRAGAGATTATTWPHCGQKRAPAGSSAPHALQPARLAPHPAQNRAPGAWSYWQRGHVMPRGSGGRRERLAGCRQLGRLLGEADLARALDELTTGVALERGVALLLVGPRQRRQRRHVAG